MSTDIKPMTAERLADVKVCLRRHGRVYTFTNIVSDIEAFELMDLAARQMIDQTLPAAEIKRPA